MLINKLNFYNNNGFVVFKKVIPKNIILNFQKDVFFASKALYFKYSKLGNPKVISFSSKNFDEYLLLARKENLSVVCKSIYDLCKKITSVYQIIAYKKVQKLIKRIMGTNSPAVLYRGISVRIDYPGDKYYKARLHTDYHSQLGSQNGIVMYASVKTVNNKMGPVMLYNKSHSFGVHDVMVDLKKVKKGLTYDPYYLSISKKKLNSYKKSKLLIDEGDVGFFNMNLLHESGYNSTTNKIRWAIVIRYFDLKSPTALEMDFKGGQHEGNIYSFKDGKISRKHE
jgi:ectoine hydroxylase-related dioxygenase (phytanoyl-CoA dioxygenase family)